PLRRAQRRGHRRRLRGAARGAREPRDDPRPAPVRRGLPRPRRAGGPPRRLLRRGVDGLARPRARGGLQGVGARHAPGAHRRRRGRDRRRRRRAQRHRDARLGGSRGGHGRRRRRHPRRRGPRHRTRRGGRRRPRPRGAPADLTWPVRPGCTALHGTCNRIVTSHAGETLAEKSLQEFVGGVHTLCVPVRRRRWRRSMKMLKHKRTGVLLAGAASLALVLSACGGADDLGGGGGGGGGGSDTETDAGGGASTDADCSAFEEYGTFDGETVTLVRSIREQEADQLQDTFEAFTECTGITVEYNGSGEFEQQVVVQAEGGNAPDLAIFPQPGLLQRMVRDGHVLPAPDAVESKVDEGWSEDWKAYGTVDGEFYAAPLMASVKSFVWYSPSAFEENGYEVPETWDDLMALTEQIAADHGSATVKPWCAGIESGGATGWPATDWIEDVVLRSASADAYDQWVANELAFNSPEIVEAVDMAGAILKNDDYVNGGIGDSRS